PIALAVVLVAAVPAVGGDAPRNLVPAQYRIDVLVNRLPDASGDLTFDTDFYNENGTPKWGNRNWFWLIDRGPPDPRRPIVVPPPALRELVRYGVAALPALLRSLGDARETKSKFEIGAANVFTYL